MFFDPGIAAVPRIEEHLRVRGTGLPRTSPGMRTRVLPAAAAAVLVLAALAGCTASGSGGSSGGGSAVDLQAGTGRTAAGSSVAGAAAVDRSIVTTGTLRLVAEHPIRAAARITDLVEAAGGRVARSTEDPADRGSADLVLRIPAAAFPRTLAAIEREGDVRTATIGSTDVTAKVTDDGVRIANLRTSIARLQTLLSKATSSSALVEIEGALTDRQGKLEQLLGEQRTLRDQVASATLSVSIVVPAAAPQRGPADFVGGVVAGADGLLRTAAAFAVGLGVALPWLVVLGALGAIAAVVVRRVRRRERPTSA